MSIEAINKFTKKKIRDVKHETGFPGSPKKKLLFDNTPKVVGFPGFIETLSNKIAKTINPNIVRNLRPFEIFLEEILIIKRNRK